MPEFVTQRERSRLAGSYAAGVQELFVPRPTRGFGLPPTSDEQADRLLPASRALTNAVEPGLAADPGSLEQAASELQLLAGIALDLIVANRLINNAHEGMRSVYAHPVTDLSEIQAIIESPEAYLAGATMRRERRGVSVDAHGTFLGSAERALDDITGAATDTGEDLVNGLLMLDAAFIREAVEAVGSDLAAKLGIDLTGLSRRAINFVLEANHKLLVLLGVDALAQIQAQLDEWVEALVDGSLFTSLIGRLYNAPTIKAEIQGWTAAYLGSDTPLLLGAETIDTLAGRYLAKANVAAKVATALSLVKLAPPLATPPGRLAIAAVYLGILAYLIGSGHDHIDSDHLKMLDRVEGVRGMAQRILASPLQ